jgi:hypothetical protein
LLRCGPVGDVHALGKPVQLVETAQLITPLNLAKPIDCSQFGARVPAGEVPK